MQVRRLPDVALLATLLVAVLSLTACGKGETTTATSPSAPPEVSVVTIRPQPIAVTTDLSGRTTGYLTAEVRPQVSGILERRVFREGSDVKAGDLLYLIAPATYQAAVDSARAALTKAQANVAAAKSKANRYSQLAKIEAVSKQSSDDAAAALAQAQADVASSRAALESARSTWASRASRRRSPVASADRASRRARWSPPARPPRWRRSSSSTRSTSMSRSRAAPCSA